MRKKHGWWGMALCAAALAATPVNGEEYVQLLVATSDSWMRMLPAEQLRGDVLAKAKRGATFSGIVVATS